MKSRGRKFRILRWMLGVFLVAAGLSATWAWGQVAQLAEPEAGNGEGGMPILFAAWRPGNAAHQALFRSIDRGETWQQLVLPGDATPEAWIAGGSDQVAVVLKDGTLLRSSDSGDTWEVAVEGLPVLSLAWGRHDDIYLGTDGRGLYRLSSNGVVTPIAGLPSGLADAPIRHMSLVASGRLVAATRNTLFYTDDGGKTWLMSSTVESGISALAAVDDHQLYVGTETMGVYKTRDAGQTWQWISEGLGLAAGQMVSITALSTDPETAGVLYVAVDHLVGSTHLHANAAGAFVSLDGGLSWQPLAGPAFPEAAHASGLVVVPGKPLSVQAVVDTGLQTYAPDLVAALEDLYSGDANARASAARLLGLAQAQDADVADALLAALSDPDPGVSLAASQALGRLGNPGTIDALLLALDHPSEQVRFGAARALGMMRAETAAGPLSDMFLRGEGPAVSIAAEALGRIGTPEALQALLEPMADLTMTGQRHAALAALESAGEPAVGPLTTMLDSSSGHIRRNAVQALGWVASPSANDALAGMLAKDHDATVRLQAAWALGQIGTPSSRAALERAARRDPDAAVRAQATSALALIPAETAAEAAWLARWAPTLSRLEPLRWLLLTLSLGGAVWLIAGRQASSLRTVPRRFDE